MAAQRGLFDLGERYAALSKAGDPLERLAGVIDFELFRPELDATLDRSDGRQGGRPPMAPVLMFKVLVIQALYGLSDAQAAFQIRRRATTSGRSCSAALRAFFERRAAPADRIPHRAGGDQHAMVGLEPGLHARRCYAGVRSHMSGQRHFLSRL